ncbi:acyltransferase family protein [Mucilaginibacter terrae]|uniref:acyltransferase family protein n=1 Tax=Mucilaginibacter terrae TaxID=1955052 RepID=UPI00363671B9
MTQPLASAQPSLITNKPVSERLDFIDSLRGLAALYVVIFHAVLVPQTKLAIPGWIKPLVMNGGSGVTLFFVISAFTLCYTLQFQQKENRYLLKFYMRRIFRILPLYYAWFLLMLYISMGFRGLFAHKFILLLYAVFGYNFVPGHQEGLVAASWTLGIEMIFYLIFPLVFHYVKSIRGALMFLALTLIIAWSHTQFIKHLIGAGILQSDSYKINLSFFHQLPVFALGMVCYFIYVDVIKNKDVSLKIHLILLSTGAILFFLLPYVIAPYLPSGTGLYFTAINYTILFLGLSKIPVKLIVNKVTVFFGLLSYSLYLNHPQIVMRLNKTYIKIYDYAGNSGVALVCCILLTLVIVVPLSYLTYRFIEQPCINYGKKLIKSIG